MTPEEAVQVATLVGKLWPRPDLGGERLAFYATALTGIPDHAAAVRAVNQLFVRERFQPVPADVIDLALDLDGRAEREWRVVVAAANDMGHRRQVGRQPDDTAKQVIWDLCGGLADVPVDNGIQLDKMRDKFVAAYRDKERQRLVGIGDERRMELGTGN